MSYRSIKDYSQSLLNSFQHIDEDQILLFKDELLKRIDGHGEIHLVGNGGSNANATHMVGDFKKSLALIGCKAKLNSLGENLCYLTAVSNDLDFSEAYEILVDTSVFQDDLIVFLSGSGNSMNLVKTALKAKKRGIKTAAILGYIGGALKNIVDIPIHIPVKDMEMSEDSQLIILHFIKQVLLDEISIENKNMSKYYKRINEDLIV